MKSQNLRQGIILMTLTSLIFSFQDGISRYLGGQYSIYMVVMIRFWFFAAFVMVLAARQRRLSIGSFLTAEERAEVARALRQALDQQRNGPRSM